MNYLADSVDAWIDAVPCNSTDSYRNYENKDIKTRIRGWIKGNYDATTAPDPCLESRIAVVGGTSGQSDDTVQKIYLHELYHALQKRLTTYCQLMGTSSNGYYEPLDTPEARAIEAKFKAGKWLAEGTAEYFSFIIQAEIKGTNDGVNEMMKAANTAANESKDINNSIASSGSAAVRLLIERGVLTEKQVMDGSLFQTCDWVDIYSAEKMM